MIKVLVLVFGFTHVLAYPQYESVENFSERLICGQDANITDYPYQLSLQYQGKHGCGASLIGDKWGVTTAQCTHGVPLNYLSVRAGTSTREQGGQVVKIKKIYQHPKYSRNDVDYDISVLEFESSITHELAKPVSLAPKGAEVKEGSIAAITGWGGTKEEGKFLKLKLEEVPIITEAMCIEDYGDSVITDRMICAGLAAGCKDTCQGDSGGPMAIDGVLTGIVALGYGCVGPKHAGVYASIPALRDYVDEILNRF